MQNRLVGALLTLILTALAAPPCLAQVPVVDLSQFPPDQVWRTLNGKITAAQDPDGQTVWRWELNAGGEAFLWLNEDLPVHQHLPEYQRFMCDLNFAQGEIDFFWPRTMGILAPPYDKVLCEWNQFYFTHPHKTWITFQQIFSEPTWYAHWASPVPEDVKMDRQRFMAFACLPKGQSCVVEMRNCRLIKDVVRVQKPYLTSPIGWPVAETDAGAFRYRTPYFVKNLNESEQTVSPALRSKHSCFDVTIEPAQSKLAPNATQRFDVLATLKADAPAMTEETAVVDFVPQGAEAQAYRTETFCTTPLPKDARRLVAYSEKEVQALRAKGQAAIDGDAKFWIAVDLAGQTEIPNAIGHSLVYPGVPHTCPVCKKGQLAMDQKWLDVVCENCGHREHHTLWADATWIASWSEIHGHGRNPMALGRAYLATGDEAYAKKAIELLTLLASGYEKLPWYTANGPEGVDTTQPPGPDAITNGASARWGNAPSYDVNFMVQDLATLHNMVVNSPTWTAEQRQLVLEHFWIPVVTELAKITPGISNMNDIINRDLILAGFATSDANMIYRATFFPTGIIGRMKDISPDGFSDEGSALNYHLAAMREWLPSLKLLTVSGMQWGDSLDRAAAALKMPLLRASLSGATYCTGNSGSSWFGVPLNHELFTLADDVMPEKLWPRHRAYNPDPVLFRDAGWAILRTGHTPAEQIQVDLDYGRSHGHGDMDRMNLGLLAFGVPLSADPGSTYNYSTSAPQGPAAASMDSPLVTNTVIVDGKPQMLGGGTLVDWQITPDPPDLQKVVAEISGIYPGVRWRRSVALADGVIMIVDDLESPEEHRYESAWHFLGKAVPGPGSQTTQLETPLGQGPYQTFLNPQKLTGHPPTMTWTFKTINLALWQSPAPNQVTYTAQTGICWDNIKGLPIDGFYTRRQANATRFITVLEPYKSNRRLKFIDLEPGKPLKVRLTFADGATREIAFENR